MFVSLKDWKDFWKSKDAADVTWATDAKGELVQQFRVYRLGTTIIIDRDGHIAYRYDGATSYKVLQAEVDVLIRGFLQQSAVANSADRDRDKSSRICSE